VYLIVMLSESQKEFLHEAAMRYRDDLPGSRGGEYLDNRGITRSIAHHYGLGYVANPLPGHDKYRGMVSIPYLRFPPNAGPDGIVVSMRFRCIMDHDHELHGKYNSVPGDPPHLYNTEVISGSDRQESIGDQIAVTEGEFDAIIATESGVPAVGVPGVQTWKPAWREALLGYTTVWILADGDGPGMNFANTLGSKLRNSKIIPMPQGMDVNDAVLKYGEAYLLERTYK
jgi:DNA primase